MKSVLFLSVFTFASLTWADSSGTTCGYMDRDRIGQNLQVTVDIVDAQSQTTVTKTYQPVSKKARAFLAAASVSGAWMCNQGMKPSEASFKVCFSGKLESLQISKISCAPIEECQGVNCGGNGFSVNSGSSAE